MAAASADMGSSVGLRETNPVAGPSARFGFRQGAILSGMTAGCRVVVAAPPSDSRYGSHIHAQQFRGRGRAWLGGSAQHGAGSTLRPEASRKLFHLAGNLIAHPAKRALPLGLVTLERGRVFEAPLDALGR